MDTYKAVTIVVLTICCAIAANFQIAKGYYALDNTKMGERLRQWGAKRVRYICWSGLLCLIFMGMLFVLHLDRIIT